jgi:penicillin amidase
VRRFGRVILALLTVALLAAVAGGCYVRAQLRASLPQLEGTAALHGLSAPVTVARDALGVPAITGATRADIARATGFLHAQDRFFQMDLQRRQPAGELSALVGPRAFEVDAEMRVHRFRHVAEQAYAGTDPEWKAILDAYAGGVNAGLQALAGPPFEYLMLRATPEPWTPEDSVLTVLAMFISLQGRQAIFEQTNQQLRDALPEPLFRFLTAVGSDWDAPVVGEAMPRPPVPGAEVADLRRELLAPANVDRRSSLADEAAIVGSNNWAVDAALSASGHALVANDMHLNIGVPNIWYRASMLFPDPADPLKELRLTGVTLPGLPVAVVGSNGYVAWGFTNTGGDWSDLVRIESDPRDPSRYLTPEGPRLFDIGDESVPVKGEAPRQLTVRGTIWGPSCGRTQRAGSTRSAGWHTIRRFLAPTSPGRSARARSTR